MCIRLPNFGIFKYVGNWNTSKKCQKATFKNYQKSVIQFQLLEIEKIFFKKMC